MTQDRFDAQLRRHLLDSADERPADGQLAAVDAAVAGTRQRLPLVARLTWVPGRIGPVPTAALRYGLIAAALVTAALAGALLAGGGSGRTTVFEGTWLTTDPADGSGMTLAVGPGSTPRVYFEDAYASGAACVEDRVKRFKALGSGFVKGNELEVAFPDGGGCGLLTVEIGSGTYRYDELTDTLVDGLDQIWSRVDGVFVVPTLAPATLAPATLAPATLAPATLAPATLAPEPTDGQGPECFEIPAGGLYDHAVGDLSLTATVPADARFGWEGYRDGFALAGSCLFGYPVEISASIPSTVFAGCDRTGAIEVGSAAEAVDALVASEAYITSTPSGVTIDGHEGTAFEIEAGSATCLEGIILWDGRDIPTDATTFVYLLDVDGAVLGITIIDRGGDEAPEGTYSEALSIVGSLQIEP